MRLRTLFLALSFLVLALCSPRSSFATTLYSESFTDADGTLLIDHNSNWTDLTGNLLKINANQLIANGQGYYATTFADSKSCVTLTTMGANNAGHIQLVARFNPDTFQGYSADFSFNEGITGATADFLIRDGVNGPFFTITSGTWSLGDVFCFSAQGTTLTMYKNDAVVASASDGSYTSGKDGVFFGFANNNARVDDYSISDFAQPVSQITALAPAKVWVGLKNSDDVGVKFDLLEQAYVGNTLISSGELDSVPAGSSGFNNAKLNTINFDAFSPVDFPPGSQLSVKLSVRNACIGSGHNSGTARLWYNDAQANSQFGASIDTASYTYFLQPGFVLGTSVGLGPKQTIDIAAGAKCSPFKSFGTWSITP